MAPAGIGTDLEGIHAVGAAVEAGRVTRLTVEKRRSNKDDVVRIVDAATDAGIYVEFVDDVRDQAQTGAPQGVVARARPLNTLSLNDAIRLLPNPAFVVLDHIEDPRNIGATARSAHAAGMTALVVSERRSAPLGATAFKAAVGTLEHLPVVVVSSVADALKQLSKADIWTVGLAGDAETSLFGLDLLERPVALCVGAEGSGLSRLVAERCDVLAHIPMAGPTESLNASVASALACFEVARIRGWVS
ncbi:MAG: 23S rRNA (guanosine(2251)-2'-O)-methyltransferase RlmB [Acidimicrobiia bacterium]